jgi:hypothetical protein
MSLQDITFLSQIGILLFLVVGYKFIKDRKLKTHGLIMTAAIAVHSITIFLVMVPSFITYLDVLTRTSFSPIGIITLIHVITGILTEILGIFLIVQWRFRPPPKMTCVKRKWLMTPLFILWVFTLILGIAFYIYYYF